MRTLRQRPEAKLDWYGRVDGKALPAGEYALTLGAEDIAGNVAEGRAFRVRIRYVELDRDRIEVPAGSRFTVGVRSDAERVAWRFAGGTGRTESGRLTLRAPRRPGGYTLFVEANGHGARVPVRVRARPGAAAR